MKAHPHRHLIHTIIYLVSASLCYFVLNTSFAANQDVTIINTATTTTTTQIKTYADISDTSYQLILSHIKIGNSRGGIDYLNLDIDNNILNIIGTAEDLVRTDIIQSLQIAQNPEKTFDSHVTKISKTTNEGQFAIMLIQQEIENYTREMNVCIEEKKKTDQTYFNSINYYNQQTLNTSLQQSAFYNECISQTRLKINAKTAILNKLEFYHNLLNSKYKFLEDKRNTILANIDVIDAELLQELDTINQTLDQYNF